MRKAFVQSIEDWHVAQEHAKIGDAICALSENECTDELMSLLARALSNQDDFAGALKVLDEIKPRCADDPYFCVRYGFALYESHRENEALEWFKKAQALGLEDINETPGRYHPTSVAKWVMFSERWAPRRVEKNEFEARCKANITPPTAKQNTLSDFDFEGFWNDCAYSLENYVGVKPTDELIAQTEAQLGYRLPQSYKTLMKHRNGGLLTKNCFENPLQRDWTPEIFGVESIYGIDPQKMYSLCGERGNHFWVGEWRYPPIGIAIADGMTGGHDKIFLDYSDCGPQGEPCVVHINQERNYEVTFLAPHFVAFLEGLFCREELEDDDD